MSATEKEPRELSWKARRRGAIYCAPACGFGCTVEDHERAVRAAEKLARRLGPSWKGEVWENLGWHYKAVSACGRIKVHHDVNCPKLFTAFVGAKDSPGGRWAFTTDDGDPHAAVRGALEVAEAEIASAQAAIEGLSSKDVPR